MQRVGEWSLGKLWDLQNDTVTTLGHHTDVVNSIAFSPDGQLLASGGDDYAFKLWDVPRKQHIATLEHINNRSRSQIKAVAFSPNGQLLATAGVEVKLWDVPMTRTEIGTLEHGKWVLAVAFSSRWTHFLLQVMRAGRSISGMFKHNKCYCHNSRVIQNTAVYTLSCFLRMAKSSLVRGTKGQK